MNTEYSASAEEVGHISIEECACTEKKEKIYADLQRKAWKVAILAKAKRLQTILALYNY